AARETDLPGRPGRDGSVAAALAATHGGRVNDPTQGLEEASGTATGAGADVAGARTETAHAKVNLGLAVIARRGDGFHEIETLMARISLADEVRVRLAGTPGVTFEASYEAGAASAVRDGAALPTGSENLAVRAAEAYLTARRARATRSA